MTTREKEEAVAEAMAAADRLGANWYDEYGCTAEGLTTAVMGDIETVREALREAVARLPEGMRHCTILFKECGKGHGWLTATNWVQHGCPTCEREAAVAAGRERVARLAHEVIGEACRGGFLQGPVNRLLNLPDLIRAGCGPFQTGTPAGGG